MVEIVVRDEELGIEAEFKCRQHRGYFLIDSWTAKKLKPDAPPHYEWGITQAMFLGLKFRDDSDHRDLDDIYAPFT